MIMEEVTFSLSKSKKKVLSRYFYCGGEEGKITFELTPKLKIL
jgi:hypothetical protein